MYEVKETADCKTSNVVYVIECNRCSKQYVGETENALHVRMSPSDINHRRLEKSVAQHFNSNGLSLEDFSVFIIKKIHRIKATFRKAKESHWIRALRSLTPEGLSQIIWSARLWSPGTEIPQRVFGPGIIITGDFGPRS